MRHLTKDCQHLRWELEQLLSDGNLGDMVEENGGHRQDNGEGMLFSVIFPERKEIDQINHPKVISE